ncbi:zinc-binding alcohol dehydrogenase family protein [Ralstonia mojiangensis]|uniref:zinc-binding alcohol dehydrogenase family protein n=1 Tax=Ralstonia mojiangensis TaxID=2953895 RepID=UPI0021B2151A|nr:zinc-binding alcohol dehydrogenase family protein [Ralstonia mojiangensis]MCT7328349.1 zinc-binding alcohol dehydrogenase family protein [Ralstonia mojiangensis]
MLTVVCETPGTLLALDRPVPTPAEGEVLLRVKRVGVCGTDLHIFTGNQPYLNYPRVMGHELSGIVEQAPAGSALAKGDVVYVMPYLSCGHCVACRQGRTNCCVNIQVLGVHRDGAFTEYLSVPQAFVHKADGVSLDQAAMVEFLAIGAHAVRRAQVRAGQRVLVVGAGPIGMAAMIFAKLRGAVVTALDSRADRLAFAVEQLSVDASVALGDSDEAQLSALTANEFYDVVFDATGNPKAMERGLRFVAHAGTYVLISVVAANISFSDPEFHKRETTLLASRNATTEDFETVLDAMRAGKIPTALNTHRMALADVPEHFKTLLDPAAGVVKAIVEC